MKSVLIISYHYPPMEVIASRRAEAYALFLKQHGIFPTILTHRWEMENIVLDENGRPCKYDWKVWKEDAEVLEEIYDSHKVIRVPIRRSKLQRYYAKLSKVPVINKLAFLTSALSGHLEPEKIDSYLSRKNFLLEHLQQYKYDAVVSIFSPHVDVRLGHEMAHKFNIPFVADYRDLWDNNLLSHHYKPMLNRAFINKCARYYHKRWLRDVAFFAAVSEPIVGKISSICNQDRGYCITNGYEAYLFNSLQKQPGGEFTILHGGTIYEEQDLSLFVIGIRKFWSLLSELEKSRVRIIFLAIKSSNKKCFLSKNLPELPIEFINRLPRLEALQLMKNASILFYPGWSHLKGIYSGKIFEYVGAQNNILVIPNDYGVVEALVKKTKSGIATSDPNEMAAYLDNQFRFWLESGYTEYNGDMEQVEKCSREYQVSRMAYLIHHNIVVCSH